MEKAKQYQVHSFDDLCDLVNDENVERLSIDLAMWLKVYQESIKAIREKMPNETKGMKNSEISKSGFTWVDDGANDLLGMTVTFKE